MSLGLKMFASCDATSDSAVQLRPAPESSAQ